MSRETLTVRSEEEREDGTLEFDIESPNGEFSVGVELTQHLALVTRLKLTRRDADRGTS
ncbi:hypothetical protein [Lapillicoccus sp.]|uniref:hypothetical protein n=1 Tax=Lapillicoccus sp. TaxID=1909287 RepID=UPI003983CCF1